MIIPSQRCPELNRAEPSRGPGGNARCGASATAWGVRAICLLVGVGLPACERAAEAPPPDMTLVRGDPIVPVESAEAAPDSTGSLKPDADWLTYGEGLILVEFDRLAGFEYVVDEAAAPSGEAEGAGQIPQAIRELDGREVGVRGFMLPIKMDGGLVREFLLMRDQSMCCFGVIPKINEWVAVTMSGRGVRAMMDQPVTVFGTLRVGEVYEHGVLGGIYRMEGVELAGALDL